MSTLKDKYTSEIVPKLKESGKYASVHQIPKLTKVVINMGMDVSYDKDAMALAVDELTTICGQ